MDRNLIYTCIFSNKDYFKLFELLLNSLNKYSPLDENTDLLLVTDNELATVLNEKKLCLHDGREIKVYKLVKNGIVEACCARLDIFDYPLIKKYDKILYIDSDILFEDNVSKIFALDIRDDKIYGYHEGIGIRNDYYKKIEWPLPESVKDDASFCTGVLMFKNSEKIKDLFQCIKDHLNQDLIINKNYIPFCSDQVFIVYNTAIRNMQDTTLLNTLMYNISFEIVDGIHKSSNFKPDKKYVIYHFYRGLGNPAMKFQRMDDFYRVHLSEKPIVYNKELEKAIFDSNSDKFKKHINNIKEIVEETGEILEGNCVYGHKTFNIVREMYTKQINISWAGRFAKRRICEIGFNAGHSAMIMLLSRDESPLLFTVFDIGVHRYMEKCFNYVSKQFPHVIMDYIKGDANLTIPEWVKSHPLSLNTYDVVHVDGGHEQIDIVNNMQCADLLVNVGGIIMIDDTNLYAYIPNEVDRYIKTGRYREVNILPTYYSMHRVIQRII